VSETGRIDGLKREVFARLMEAAGRVFVLVSYSDRVHVGRRGFLPEEKEKGLVLVFNPSMKYHWDEGGLNATLVFGSAPEKCRIPFEDITAIYSPELNVQFAVGAAAGAGAEAGEARRRPLKAVAGGASGGNVIEVDFKRAR
jgi:hypothetical protein